MKDELKIFTDQHRESFEQYSLDLDESWKVIDDQLNSKEQKPIHLPWVRFLKVAAVFFVLSLVGAGIYVNNMRSGLNKNGIALHNISADLADTEAYYSLQIEEKLEMIKTSAGNVDSEIQTQLRLLDDEYLSLKNDLNDRADSEEVINAMIENYRLKLQMLEKILEEIQENDENNDYEEVQAI